MKHDQDDDVPGRQVDNGCGLQRSCTKIVTDTSDRRPAIEDSGAHMDSRTGPSKKPPAVRNERLGVALTAFALIAWACWRTQFGADTGDGGHSVTMAVRLAQGAVPFVDETNAQATGSLLAVPFTWLWLHAVGLDGIVLASRLFFVVLSTAAGFIAYRALRPAFRPWVAFAIPAIALVPTSYNLMLVNYTTVPSMAMVVATAAGHAAIVRKSVWWAPVSGAAATIAAFSHPAALPSAALFIVICLLLIRTGRVRLLLLMGATVVSLVVAVWLLGFVGWSNISDTLKYTADYQSGRVPPIERARLMLESFAKGLSSQPYLPMWVLAAMALIPRLNERLRVVLMVSAIVAAAVPALLMADTIAVAPQPFGRLSGVYATIVTLGLLVPAVVAGLRTRDRSIRSLLALTLPPALISFPITAAVSSASPFWGIAVMCIAPAFATVAAMPAMLTPKRSLRLIAFAVVTPLLALTGVHTLTSFRDPAPWKETALITEGAFSGIRATPARAGAIEETRKAVQQWARPQDSVLIYGNIAAYLFVPGRIDTNIIWLPTDSASNQFTLDFYARRHDFPDVVILFAGSRIATLGEERWRHSDPLIDYFYLHYDKVATGATSSYLVFRNPAAD